MDTVADVLISLDSKVHEYQIRDCQRLGKYSETKHRPILVKFSRSCDVTSILSSRAKLAERPGISIKPDMTKEEKKLNQCCCKSVGSLSNQVLLAHLAS